MYYIHKDYLGSYDVVTNQQGQVVEEYSFDPWGRRRNPTNWTYNNVPQEYLFDRGYTGHEHLDIFGLINMNGRVYDPWLGRFLSVDPYIQNPGNSQSYNRYSYCLNNPLKYTDPSGYNYLLDLKRMYNYEGGGFYYRGDYYSYNSEYRSFNSGTGQNLGGTGYYYENGQYYYNDEPVSYNQVFNNYIAPKVHDCKITMYETHITPILSKKRRSENSPEYALDDGTTWYIWEMKELTVKRVFISEKPQGGEDLLNSLGNYTDEANNSAYGIVLGSNLYNESTRGLTTTTSTIAREVQAANVLSKIATVTKWTGYLGNTISIAANTVNVYNDPTAANYARAAVNGFAVGLNLVNFVVPGLGTGLSLIVSTADMLGGFNWLYNSLETNKKP